MHFVSIRLLFTFLSHAVFTAILLCLLVGYSASAADQLININTADPATLAEQLPGIGPTKARAIVVYREEFGFFKTLEQLTEVKGIGPSTLEKIRPYIFIDQIDLQQSSNATVTQAAPLIGKTQLEQEAATREAVRAVMTNVLRNRRGLSP